MEKPMISPPDYASPDPSEYAPYQQAYLDLVPAGNILQCLERQLPETLTFFENLPESRGDHAYAPGKWTLKEVLGHIADTERVLSYRALRVARGDTIPLPAFDQDSWVRYAACVRRQMPILLEEMRTVRQATLCLFRSLDTDALLRRGRTDSGNPFTVRAVPYIIAGHELHHLRIVRERYL
jgi:hypothetical protein